MNVPSVSYNCITLVERTASTTLANVQNRGAGLLDAGPVIYMDTVNSVKYMIQRVLNDFGTPDVDMKLQFRPYKITDADNFLWTPAARYVGQASTKQDGGNAVNAVGNFKKISTTKFLLFYRDTFGGTNLLKAFIGNL
jgi:hypothetical protein